MFVILIFPVINGRHVNNILINSKTWSSNQISITERLKHCTKTKYIIESYAKLSLVIKEQILGDFIHLEKYKITFDLVSSLTLPWIT